MSNRAIPSLTLFISSVSCVIACSSSSATSDAPVHAIDAPASQVDAPAMSATTTIAAARAGNVTTPITVQAVVTALHGAPGDYSEWYIEDAAGGPHSGVNVYCDKDKSCSLPEPAMNDLILITGSLSTYHGVVQLTPTAKSTVQTGAALPPIPTLTMTDLAEGANSPYRGVLVKYDATALTVDNIMPAPLYDTQCAKLLDGGVSTSMPLCTGCAPPTYSGFQANDGAGNEIYIEETFFNTDHLQSSPECASASGNVAVTTGMTFSSMQGILDYDGYAQAQQLSPTKDSDYTTP